jgi:diketogulonate reductase-like aldo/keto reductase
MQHGIAVQAYGSLEGRSRGEKRSLARDDAVVRAIASSLNRTSAQVGLARTHVEQ